MVYKRVSPYIELTTNSNVSSVVTKTLTYAPPDDVT